MAATAQLMSWLHPASCMVASDGGCCNRGLLAGGGRPRGAACLVSPVRRLPAREVQVLREPKVVQPRDVGGGRLDVRLRGRGTRGMVGRVRQGVVRPTAFRG